jgi:DNA processing protein
VPGEVGSSRSRGAHRLIRQGAKLVEGVDDIIEEIAPQLLDRTSSATQREPRVLPQTASDAARTIFALLQENTLQVDQVIERTGISAAQVLETLLDLELQGLLRQLPGKIYRAER